MPPDVTLPPDPVLMERALAGAIAAILAQLPHIGPIHTRQRFPDDEALDQALTTDDDPVVGDKEPLTNFIEIGLPSVSESPYTSDTNTLLLFTYPITYTLGVRDVWDRAGFEFNSSGEMFIGTYMRARKLFAENRTLGFTHCEHFYLQQDAAGTALSETGEAVEHVGDWSLTIQVSGKKQ